MHRVIPRLLRVTLAFVLLWIGLRLVRMHDRLMNPLPQGWQRASRSWRVLLGTFWFTAAMSAPGRAALLITVGRDPLQVWPCAPMWMRLLIAVLAGGVTGEAVLRFAA